MEEGRNRCSTCRRRWLWALAALAAIGLAGWLLRHAALGAMGRFLIREDALAHADAIMVLGGAPVERGPAGAALLRAGWAPRLVFTGERLNELLLVYGIARSEAAASRDAAALDSAWVGRASLLEKGTSTYEEADAIAAWAQAGGIDTLIVVTTEFHTRRAGQVFRRALGPAGITVVMHAAPGCDYDAARWWESEAGLIMVNNEYMKLLYYALMH